MKRKKAHEHSLEQTSAQISMLENQIYSIESANINQETLLAMKNASKAMKDIHGNLTIDKVDDIMYVSPFRGPYTISLVSLPLYPLSLSPYLCPSTIPYPVPPCRLSALGATHGSFLSKEQSRALSNSTDVNL